MSWNNHLLLLICGLSTLVISCGHSALAGDDAGGDSDIAISAPIDGDLAPDAVACEVSPQCQADEYCLDGVCELQTHDYDDLAGFPGLTAHAGVCRVVMHDDLNQIEPTLQVEQINDVLFVVTSGVGTEEPWSVEAVLYEDGVLAFDAGVPDLTHDVLLQRYPLTDTGQLTFDLAAQTPCSALERSLVFFLIMEWFFFG